MGQLAGNLAGNAGSHVHADRHALQQGSQSIHQQGPLERRRDRPADECVGRRPACHAHAPAAAVEKFGAKEWHKIAVIVPTRTDMQCREHYHNMFHEDRSCVWSDEANALLLQFVAEHGRSWTGASKVVASDADVPLTPAGVGCTGL